VAKKYYVVWQGRETGVFTDWMTCKKHIDHFPGARYKSFKTLSEAESAFKGGSSSTPTGFKKPAGGIKKKAGIKTYTAVEIAAMPIDTKIYTDGGCEPNPGEAGSGIAVYKADLIAELWYGLYNPKGTNNTAELNALLQALMMAKDEVSEERSVAIFCDSKYSIQCVTQWAAGWEKKGWKKAGGEIKNLELIQEMYALYQTLKSKIQVLHVNGHVGVEGNELADRMSILAIQSRDPDFTRYQDDIDIKAILATRAG
jgi:ribonuclease HI